MSLDLSGPKQLARDFFRLSHDYQTHDPDLAAEIYRKAYTICDEFGLDVASIQRSDPFANESVDHLYASQSDKGQTIERPANRQNSVGRSNRSMLSWWLDRQQAV